MNVKNPVDGITEPWLDEGMNPPRTITRTGKTIINGRVVAIVTSSYNTDTGWVVTSKPVNQ